MPERRPQLTLAPTSASAEEAAAIVAAIERFMRATAPVAAPRAERQDRWRQVAILEGISREQEDDAPHPWINT
jgi:hypothetical protein